MVKLKSINVKVSSLKAELKTKIFDIALEIKKTEGEYYTMVITSGNDGKHMPGSKHYSNEAIDIRINNMKWPEKACENIKKMLGKNYDVILEKTHIHIEYDKKRMFNFKFKKGGK